MVVNHLVVHLKETKGIIASMQKQVQKDPLKGFWLVSGAAFIVAPFLTNDGVCLLFVQLILDAFETVKKDSSAGNTLVITDRSQIVLRTVLPLETGDLIYPMFPYQSYSNAIPSCSSPKCNLFAPYLIFT